MARPLPGLLLALAVASTVCPSELKHRHAIEIIWQDPGNVSRRDLVLGPGGRAMMPRAPLHFIEEELAGTNPKIKVRDHNGREWSVKWGPEAYASPFSSHLVWACGYEVEVEYFVARGRVHGAHDLTRAAAFVKPDGSFQDARFQLRSKSPKFLKDSNWAWTNNPFQGTPQFNGLRIMMMLLSNWDAKDARNFANDGTGHGRADSNLGIFEAHGKPVRYIYAVTDWGATLGKWSPVPLMRTKWDSKGFAQQTPDFVKGVQNGEVQWGFAGTHNPDITRGIRVTDVRWLLQYLGRVTDAQLRNGLVASGATPQDTEIFARALRDRIRQLERIASNGV